MTTRLFSPAVAAVLLLASACGGESEPELNLSPLGTEGREIANSSGCSACHGNRGQGSVGPAWAGLPGEEVELEDGTIVVADDEYLARAIADPQAEVVGGYTITMPENALTDEEIDAVIAYIKELG